MLKMYYFYWLTLKICEVEIILDVIFYTKISMILKLLFYKIQSNMILCIAIREQYEYL